MKRALTIAGSDSGGGAGIQADLKTFAAFGLFGMSVLTALTAQNTVGVQAVFEVPPEFVRQQLDSVLNDIGADVVKTGMLSNAEIIAAVADGLRAHRVTTLVIDPVMVAKSGDPLLQPSAREALIQNLLPLALVVTPNRYEAEVLTGMTVATRADMEAAARAIHALGPRVVVVKGGHVETGDESVDLLFDGDYVHLLRTPRIATTNTHGTGCTFASAIAAGLARGLAVLDAAERAKRYLSAALAAAAGQRFGAGHGPVDHFAPAALAVSGLCHPTLTD
ncbi:MAG: bifunctional hydroxymethylpyrimidine kinase/phosphomethylpyrimidine kinase [Ardenticatenaceae bacterium]|nr:bifunctional hydroxymethylpyrimidine kinase/phosphomethylpyrimidine kinase [Ardenticatenaceae bacterium]